MTTDRKAGYTPGPWRIDEGTLDCVMGADGRKVADAAIAWRDSDTVLANSRLIAAAPDLLAALEGIMREYRHLMGDETPEIADAFAAIARAQPKP